jgi:hypothetical protein
VAGAMEQRRPTRSELDREGARLGASFGLGGAPQAAHRARRRSAQWGYGTSVLGLAFISVFVVPDFQHRWTPEYVVALSAAVVVAVVLMAFAPRSKWDRLYWYPGGVAQRLATEPEPRILPWADATSVRVGYVSDDDSVTLDHCVVDGPGQVAVEVDRKYQGGLAAFAREAERVMEIKALPGLIGAYEHGQPVVFGELTITRAGLGYQPRIGRNSWSLPWAEVRAVKAYGPGRSLSVQPRPFGASKRWINLEELPNGLLAHRVVEHAAARYGIPVKLRRD